MTFLRGVLLALGMASDDKRLQELREKAEQGEADAQYNLGGMYYIGEGVPQDYAEAVKWYRLYRRSL